jgi:predicted RNase H-like HicB family nuclease
MRTEFEVEFEQEEDGRWIAQIPILPGVLAYGITQHEARLKVEELAKQVAAQQGSSE